MESQRARGVAPAAGCRGWPVRGLVALAVILTKPDLNVPTAEPGPSYAARRAAYDGPGGPVVQAGVSREFSRD